ncbi:MAG: LPS export ABC transporter periplasmic protein LptC [Rhodospirillaceae bacterium]|nr:LPS export ABC transporter periplasmic protein LptC [Rhodospirillaceae bacterium]
MIVAIILIGTILIWSKMISNTKLSRSTFTKVDLKDFDVMSMTNPRYFGTDDKNLPFVITADVATTFSADDSFKFNPNKIETTLKNPKANLKYKDGGNMLINSTVGLFRHYNNTIDLRGHVDLFYNNGYEIHTNNVHIELKSGNVTGNNLTRGNCPLGTIEGDGFRLLKKSKTIIITGKSKAILNMTKVKSD